MSDRWDLPGPGVEDVPDGGVAETGTAGDDVFAAGDPFADDPFSAEIADVDPAVWDVDADAVWGPADHVVDDLDLPF